MLKLIPAIALAIVAFSSAEAYAAGKKSSNSSREAAFKAECELLGGTFKRDRQTGTIICLTNGGIKICDRGARNCEYFPNPRVVPRLGQVLTDGGVAAF